MNDYVFWGIVVALLLFAYWMRERHDWRYRDPYDRHCKKCGRWERSGNKDWRHRHRAIWIVRYAGDGSCTK